MAPGIPSPGGAGGLGTALDFIPSLPPGTGTAINLLDRLFGSPIQKTVGKALGNMFGGEKKHSVSFPRLNLTGITPGNFVSRMGGDNFGPIRFMGSGGTSFRNSGINLTSLSLGETNDPDSPVGFTIKGLKDFAKLSGEKGFVDMAKAIEKQRGELFRADAAGGHEARQAKNQQLLQSLSVAEDLINASLGSGKIPREVAEKFYINRDTALTQNLLNLHKDKAQFYKDELSGENLKRERDEILSKLTGDPVSDSAVLKPLFGNDPTFSQILRDPFGAITDIYNERISAPRTLDGQRVSLGGGGQSPAQQFMDFYTNNEARLEALKQGKLPDGNPFSQNPVTPTQPQLQPSPSTGPGTQKQPSNTKENIKDVAGLINDIFNFLNKRKVKFNDTASVGFGVGGELDDLVGFGRPLGFAVGKVGSSTGVSGSGQQAPPLGVSELENLATS